VKGQPQKIAKEHCLQQRPVVRRAAVDISCQQLSLLLWPTLGQTDGHRTVLQTLLHLCHKLATSLPKEST